MRFLLVALLLSGCAHKAGFVVTGHSLLELEHQFSVVADAMDKGLDSGAVSPDEYKAWRAFGERFQVAYPRAVSTWRASRAANDAALQGSLGAAVAGLTAELAGYLDTARRLKLVTP